MGFIKDIPLDTEVVIALIALSGVVVSGLLAAISYFYKKDFEVKRSGRRLLYFLLEIRYIVLVSMRSPNDMAEKFMAACKKIFAANGMEMNNEVLDNAIGELVRSHIESLSSAMKVEIDDELIKLYEKELLEFSNINPVLAYRLKGKQRVQAAVNETSSYISKLSDAFSGLPQMKPFVEPISPVAKSRRDKALSDIMNDLDEEILELSAYCGRRDYKASKRVLDSSRNNAVEFPDLEVQLMEVAKAVGEAINIDLEGSVCKGKKG